MTRRLLLLLAATWPRPAGAFVQAPPKSESNASSDSAVLEVVLTDLLSWPDSPLEFPETAEKQLLFSPEALTDPLKVSEILDGHGWRKRTKLSRAEVRLAREAAGDLVRRREMKHSFSGLRPKDPRIVIWDRIRAESKRGRVRPQVFRAYAPGYSRDRRLAIVRLTFPWSIHDGEGTYVLARKEGEWVVLTRDFVYYL
jgi:hypothetical protein